MANLQRYTSATNPAPEILAPAVDHESARPSSCWRRATSSAKLRDDLSRVPPRLSMCHHWRKLLLGIEIHTCGSASRIESRRQRCHPVLTRHARVTACMCSDFLAIGVEGIKDGWNGHPQNGFHLKVVEIGFQFVEPLGQFE